MWLADRDFAYGKNLDSVSHYVEAYPYLKNAVDRHPSEPTFRDELSYNESVLASAAIKTATDSAKQLANAAISDSNIVIETSPNSMPFWKTRTRVFYQLATIDPKYNLEALTAIEKAADLAPTDAKVHYNLGILLAKTGQTKAAIQAFEETIKMKPDYNDAKTALEETKKWLEENK